MIKTYAYKDMKIDEIFAREEEKSTVMMVMVSAAEASSTEASSVRASAEAAAS